MNGPHPITGEDGVAVVTVALWLPLLVLFVSFAIDVGNWFLHDRHLQLQADAGALAAGGDFSFSCDDAEVEATAREYSGTAEGGGGYNHQVGGTPPEEVHFELNSPTFFDQPTPIDETVAGPPCEAGMVDVKLTETDLPLFLRVADLFASVPFINAHARVQVFKRQFVSGALPVAVPDPNPSKVKITFVDEENGDAPIESTELSKEEGGEAGLAFWSAPTSLPVESGRIGMRVALSGGQSTECGDPLVQCYDNILFARGYTMAGSGAQPNAPLARDVYLTPGSCDPYFSSEQVGCSVGVRAAVDFGPCEKIAEVGATLSVVVGGSEYPMAMPEGEGCPAGTSTSVWETSGAPIPVPAGTGPIAVSLKWTETKGNQGDSECNDKGGNKCNGTFDVVQRSFAGDEERSGPIRVARIEDEARTWANSFERCPECSYPVVVRIGVDQNLLEKAEDAASPPVQLRVEDPSQNQSLDCDPELGKLRDELALGCAPKYKRNEGTVCPTQIAVLWNETPEPWPCVAVQTGKAKGQILPGLNERVHGDDKPSSCISPNNWPLFPDLPSGDPRIVPIFLTAFGSFSGSGNTTVPVTDFAIFYVTGWSGQGVGNDSKSTCDGSLEETPDDGTAPGTIVGHFIQYVQALNDGSASEEACDFDSLTPCVAVLTE